MLANRRPTGEFDQQSMPVPCVEQGRNAAALLDREVDGLGAGDDGLDDVGSEEGQWQEAADLIAVQIGMGHAAPKFLRKAIKRNGQPNVFVTYRLPAYRAVLKNVEMAKRQETSRWLNNRVENSH